MTTERERFEEWCRTTNSMPCEHKWIGWQAALSAPAEPKGADGLPVSAPRLYADEEPPGHADHGSKARDLFDAAPSVVPEPVAWEELAWSLFTHIRHGDDGHKAWLHRELRTWFALNYPPRAPLTDAEIAAIVLRTVYEGDASTPHRDAWAAEIGVPFARAIEAAHGIGGK